MIKLKGKLARGKRGVLLLAILSLCGVPSLIGASPKNNAVKETDYDSSSLQAIPVEYAKAGGVHLYCEKATADKDGVVTLRCRLVNNSAVPFVFSGAGVTMPYYLEQKLEKKGWMDYQESIFCGVVEGDHALPPRRSVIFEVFVVRQAATIRIGILPSDLKAAREKVNISAVWMDEIDLGKIRM